MLPLLQAFAALGAGIAQAAARRAAATAAGLLFAGSLLLASLGFFTLAAYRALALSIGEINAPLVVGTVYLVAALLALLIVQRR